MKVQKVSCNVFYLQRGEIFFYKLDRRFNRRVKHSAVGKEFSENKLH